MRGGGPQTLAASLSGGNQQKVVIAREVSRDPNILVAAQPTRGLDVGAIEFVHRRLVQERDEGRGILLVSFELDEILSLSDRILVIYEGRVVGEYSPDVSEEELGFAMTGGKKQAAAEQHAAPEPPTATSTLQSYFATRIGGILVPLGATILAFFIGGLVVLITGHNPLAAYKAIFEGTGLNWFFPWVTGEAREDAATTSSRRWS